MSNDFNNKADVIFNFLNTNSSNIMIIATIVIVLYFILEIKLI